MCQFDAVAAPQNSDNRRLAAGIAEYALAAVPGSLMNPQGGQAHVCEDKFRFLHPATDGAYGLEYAARVRIRFFYGAGTCL